MDTKKFEAVLVLLVPQVVQLIVENCGGDEVAAARDCYSSQVDALLEQEKPRLWHRSRLWRFHM